MIKEFELITNKIPAGDQPFAIKKILEKLKNKEKEIILKGATGTGKTFTIANVIKENKKPTLILSHNKTLANQLYVELKNLFPNNRVEYYISNFDFYQPEAYLPSKDAYIEKQSIQNWQIEMMRSSALSALSSKRNDVIVVASVAAIYGHRSPEEYIKHHFEIEKGTIVKRINIFKKLINLGYQRSETLNPGCFTSKGDTIEISPSWTDQYNIRVELFGDEIEEISEIDSIEKKVIKRWNNYTIYPANPNVVSPEILDEAIIKIKKDLQNRSEYYEKKGLPLEKERIENRVNLDLEQLNEFGMTSGIENYSIYFEPWRNSGEPPCTLFDYFPKDFLLVVDESHISLPQIRGMYAGDRSRKQTLVDYGFRLPSSLDNRPLKFNEFEGKKNQVIYVTATPGDYESEITNKDFIEQIIRPTGLLDPIIEIRNEVNQLDDIEKELIKRKKIGERVFINTTTKKLAEDISDFFSKKNHSVAYLHSELKTFERDEVIRKLRIGFFDAVVGINLLREGLDVPEVSLIAILDADKEGFLRNTRSLIQMVGRVSRNSNGRAIFYASKKTRSMEEAIKETNYRREKQIAFNLKNNIIPKTIVKEIPNSHIEEIFGEKVKISSLNKKEKIKQIEKEMTKAAKEYDFEKAIKLRDILTEIRK